MKKQHLDVGRFAQGLILLNFSVYLYKLFKTGEINRLVAPYLSVLVVFMFGILVLLTLFAFLTSFTRDRDEILCECCEHERRPHLRKSWLLLLIPSVMGLCFPVYSLNVSMIPHTMHMPRAVSFQVIHHIEKPEPEAPAPTPTSEMEARVHQSQLAKEISLIDLSDRYVEEPKRYNNQRYKLMGIVYHPPGWPSYRIIAMRYMITCCAADATPIGLTVESKEAMKYRDNSWVVVEGIMSVRQMPEADTLLPINWAYEQKEKPILLVDSIKSVHEPKDPYLYAPVINLTSGVK